MTYQPDAYHDAGHKLRIHDKRNRKTMNEDKLLIGPMSQKILRGESLLPPAASSFKNRLRTARDRKGWTQAFAAEQACMQPCQWAFYEQGQRTPSIANLASICIALNVSADWLLGL